MGYGDKEKRIVFYETDKRHAELKIKLHYDGLKQGQFFRTLIEGYLNDDENILKFISNQKEEKSIQSKRQRSIVNKERQLAKENESQFALNKDEVDSIFDLLEKETGL